MHDSVRGPELALILLCAGFFARILTALGAPAVVNFVHFGLAIGFVALVLPAVGGAARALVLGLLSLLCVICLSALWNDAGVVNALLDFLLLSEPFLLLLLLAPSAGRTMAPARLRRVHAILAAFVMVHVAFAYHQVVVAGLTADDVKGVFLGQGAGHHVGGAVALSAAVYLAWRAGFGPPLARVPIALLVAGVTVLSDSKQVIAVFVGSLVVLALTRADRVKKAVGYVAGGVLAVGISAWAATTVWPALGIWVDPTRIQIGMEQKLSIIPLLESYHDSPVQQVLGLGPGHTVGRLGKMLPAYEEILMPLGATTHPSTEAAQIASQSHWVSNSTTGSSVWALFFFWAGLWGDLGLLGVLVYAGLWAFVWRRVCTDDVSRFFVINILAFGVVFTWLEEPGYTLFVAMLIGLAPHVAAVERESAATAGATVRGRPRLAAVRGDPVPVHAGAGRGSAGAS